MNVNNFVAHVLDLLAPLRGVTARKMFGGYGIYRGGVMFALVADDVLYFKVDDRNRRIFERAGTKPFVYDGKAKPVKMSYWETPADAFDDSAAMLDLARGALDVALRAKQAKPKPAPKAAPKAAKRARI